MTLARFNQTNFCCCSQFTLMSFSHLVSPQIYGCMCARRTIACIDWVHEWRFVGANIRESFDQFNIAIKNAFGTWDIAWHGLCAFVRLFSSWFNQQSKPIYLTMRISPLQNSTTTTIDWVCNVHEMLSGYNQLKMIESKTFLCFLFSFSFYEMKLHLIEFEFNLISFISSC